MEGFLDLLIIGFVLYATLRGMMGARRRGDGEPDQPRKPPVRQRAERKEIDWDEAIGDVLEGLGIPRPEEARPDRPVETQGADLEVRDVGGGLPVEDEPIVHRRPRRPSKPPRPVRPAEDRTLIEIAALAEAATQRREARQPSAGPRPRVDPTLPPGEDLGATSRRTGTPAGLKKLEDYSELERAVLYAEILGPPKALNE